MKKYIIKNADGSEQSEMQAIHESRNIQPEKPKWLPLPGQK